MSSHGGGVCVWAFDASNLPKIQRRRAEVTQLSVLRRHFRISESLSTLETTGG